MGLHEDAHDHGDVCTHGTTIVDSESELHAGRVDPRVGSGRVGPGRIRKFTNMNGSGPAR